MMNSLDDRAAIARSHLPPRVSRWIVLLAVPLLLFSMLIVTMQNGPVAQAAGEITVGGLVRCGFASDHDTIQDAVNAAISGTVINICPGTYPESVDLSAMASNSGGGERGDLTLRKRPGSTGDVLINPASGSGLYLGWNDTFPGNITIMNIRVDTGTGSGIDLGSPNDGAESIVDGSVVLSDVHTTNNPEWGAFIRATGYITIENSIFSNNSSLGGDDYFEGLEIHHEPVSVDPFPSVYLNGVTANRNYLDGIYIESPGNIEIYNTEASGNGLEVEYNGYGEGIYIYQGYSIYRSNDYALCGVGDAPFILLESVSANDNLGYGIWVDEGVDVYANDVEVTDNGLTGLDVYSWLPCSYTRIEVADSYAANNGWGDAPIIDSVGDIEVAIPYDPLFGGISLDSGGGIWVGDGTIAEGNTGFGFCLYSDLDAVVEDALAEANLGDGFSYGTDCLGIFPVAAGGQSISKAGIERTSAARYEVKAIAFNPSLVISNSSAIANSGAGFAVIDPFLPVTLTNISALSNITGVAFLASDDCLCVGSVDSPTLRASDVGPGTLIFNSLIQGNVTHGLIYQQDVSFPPAPISTNAVHSTILCENGVGLRAEQVALLSGRGITTQDIGDFLLSVDARGNWWGSTTGPYAPGNEDGAGNRIEIAPLNIQPTIAANAVELQFDPWINTLQATAVPSPTLPSIPVSLEYRFRDAAATYFLENGVGDPHNGPIFNLSATNGTIVDSPPAKSILNTYINGTATPTAPGVMAVRLDGPCGLSPILNVPVATPAIAVTKSPAMQIVPTGQSAVFTVTVQNMGDIALTNVAVADANTPSCTRSLANLAVGGSITFSCSQPAVTSNFVNTIEAGGVALLESGPAGARVSDTASAEVVVASFILTKTAYVDGYREVNGGDASNPQFNPSECALASAITVPVGSAVKYCYTITNTGSYTLSTHTLTDNLLGTILSAFKRDVGPGQSFSTVDVGIKVTSTLQTNTTNIATWTADATTQQVAPTISALQATIPVVAVAQATVTISAPGQDQDGDGIPDNEEGTGDWNRNGIPDYLDPLLPTNEPPTEQPSAPGDLYLPSLGNN
ncbi:MAG: right-handed parallel beta-helix repeat-containing protein [Caldilineaceae bacterium]|nr:right-handed parallel beta-helix repeat-containing protein [Caldilineaceae bacterium]